MTNFNRDELDNAIVISKLGMLQYLEVTIPARTYKVVVANGVPIELSAFTTILMRYASGTSSSITVTDDLLQTFWRDIGFSHLHAPKIKSIPTHSEFTPNPSLVVLEAILGDSVNELVYVWGSSSSAKHDFLPMVKELSSLMRNYQK